MKPHPLFGLIVLLALGTSGCAWLRPDRAARVATGTTAHDLCSETFISGFDPDVVFRESVRPRPGLYLIAPLLRYAVNRERGEVEASIAGGFSSRSVYRGDRGCLLVKQSGLNAEAAAQQTPAVRTAPAVVPDKGALPGLQTAIDESFAENVPGALRQTKAVLVMHEGKLLAERYADGYGPATKILGFSLSKSVVNALIGVLVRDGKLQLDKPIEPAHDGLPPITLEEAMRMTTGLDLDETGSGFDPSNHLLYVHTQDMAAFAMRAKRIAPPGQRWAYSSASTHLAARQLRDALGGGDAVRRFAQERLFRPLGIERVVMETDETDTPIGAHYMFATARDWARLGQLFLDDGVAPDGQRLLPEDWVRWSTTPTLNTTYGAGWWLNQRAAGAAGPGYDMPLMPDVPPDAFYGLGNLGQWIVVVPSQRLVVVRLGRAHTPDFDFKGMNQLIAAALAALPKRSASRPPSQPLS
jgi:CubicO group peptidase (beta-lactamase class C family)